MTAERHQPGALLASWMRDSGLVRDAVAESTVSTDMGDSLDAKRRFMKTLP
jgi:hypothetical protein